MDPAERTPARRDSKEGRDPLEVKKEKVQAFFDGLAGGWDAERCPDGEKIRSILDDAGVGPGMTVLDVACGTGVLFPYYLERGVARVTGVDLSPEMIRLAGEKCQDSRVTLVVGDAETLEAGSFDRIVVFNAFPHFPDPERLLGTLSARLTPGGRLTVAHDRSRWAINGHHEQTASEVSLGLPPAETVAKWMGWFLAVDRVLDGQDRYVVSGVLTQDK